MSPDHEPAPGPARIVRVDRGLVTIRTGDGELRRVRNRITSSTPATVGDLVELAGPEHDAVGLLPRTSVLQRRAAGSGGGRQAIAANVDVALLCEPLSGPANARRIERMVLLARAGGIEPVVVLTKSDLSSDIDDDLAVARRAAPSLRVLTISVATDPGHAQAALHSCVPAGSVAVLLGPSGAGKSTITNLLVGSDVQLVMEIRESGTGRHTTTASTLLELPGGGLLVDTPGVRELGLADADDGAVDDVFPELAELAGSCRFADCSHTIEPGCAIVTAVALDDLDQSRVDSWRKLQREADRERARTDAGFARERNRVRKAEYVRYAKAQRNNPKRFI